MIVDSMNFGNKVIDALGLPKNIKWFELRCHIDEVVTIKCCMTVQTGPDELIDVLKKYRLEEIDE